MKKTITICDRCQIECGPTLRRQIDVGSSFDGHRNERDILLIELCPDCQIWWTNNINALTGKNGSHRPFTTEQAEQALAIIIAEGRKYET